MTASAASSLALGGASLGLPMTEQPNPDIFITADVVPITCKKCGHMSLFNVKPIFASPPAK